MAAGAVQQAPNNVTIIGSSQSKLPVLPMPAPNAGAIVAAAAAAASSSAANAVGVAAGSGGPGSTGEGGQRQHPFRHLLTDSLAERNRRLQSLLGNLDSANAANGGPVDPSGMQVSH